MPADRITVDQFLAIGRQRDEASADAARLRRALGEIRDHCGAGQLRCESCGTPESVSKMAAEALQGGK